MCRCDCICAKGVSVLGGEVKLRCVGVIFLCERCERAGRGGAEVKDEKTGQGKEDGVGN